MFFLFDPEVEAIGSYQQSKGHVGFQRGARRPDADEASGSVEQLTRIGQGLRLALRTSRLPGGGAEQRTSDALIVVDVAVAEPAPVAQEISVYLAVESIDH